MAVEKNGNGNGRILNIISVAIAVGTIVFSVIYVYGKREATVDTHISHTEKDLAKVSQLREAVEETKRASAVTGTEIVHLKEEVDEVQQKVDSLRVEQAQQQAHLTDVREDVTEIKEDVKQTQRILLRLERKVDNGNNGH